MALLVQAQKQGLGEVAIGKNRSQGPRHLWGEVVDEAVERLGELGFKESFAEVVDEACALCNGGLAAGHAAVAARDVEGNFHAEVSFFCGAN